jgi:hypothetical protein
VLFFFLAVAARRPRGRRVLALQIHAPPAGRDLDVPMLLVGQRPRPAVLLD